MNKKRILPFFRTSVLHLVVSSYPINFNEGDKEEHLRRSLEKLPHRMGILAMCCDTISFDPAKISKEDVLAYLKQSGVIFSLEKETKGFAIGY